MEKISTQPLNGFRDFLPEDWKVQNYIFNTWQNVCESYGYKEYNGPVLENASIYNKSGDDVGTSGKELYAFKDRGDRNVAMRPEMTPSVGRMVAAYGKQYSKPIKWFSIAQFFRAERPQKGRGREFFQLNADIFGVDSVYADVEVIQLAIDILREFKATSQMFKVKINNRKFTDFYFSQKLGVESDELKNKLLKLVDAYPKKSDKWLEDQIKELDFGDEMYKGIKEYLELTPDDISELAYHDEGAYELTQIFNMLKETNYIEYCELDTTIARGFDYYTGMVFEVFDMNPDNNRSMFGGGRYDDLLDLFGEKKMPAVGFAPGDITTRLFLENWGLLDGVNLNGKETYFIPVINPKYYPTYKDIADKIRREGFIADLSLSDMGISEALRYANKNGFDYVVIMGEEERDQTSYKLKNMETGKENLVKFA